MCAVPKSSVDGNRDKFYVLRQKTAVHVFILVSLKALVVVTTNLVGPTKVVISVGKLEVVFFCWGGKALSYCAPSVLCDYGALLRKMHKCILFWSWIYFKQVFCRNFLYLQTHDSYFQISVMSKFRLDDLHTAVQSAHPSLGLFWLFQMATPMKTRPTML